MKHLVIIFLLLATFSGCKQKPAQQVGSHYHSPWLNRIDSIFAPVVASRDSASLAFSHIVASERSDSLFADFRVKYLNGVVEKGNSLGEDESYQEYVSGAYDSVQHVLTSLGLLLLNSEGNYWIDGSSEDLLKRFGSHVTASARDFLAIRAKEEAEGFTNDNVLLISWNQLADRITIWEKYLDSHSRSVFAPEAHVKYDLYMAMYLQGSGNSPIFAYPETDGSRGLDSAVDASYHRFIREQSQSKSGEIVKRYYELLKRNSFAPSDSIRLFMEVNKVPWIDMWQLPIN